MSKEHEARVQAALSLDGSNASIESLYATWAGNYDDDLRAERYTAPQTMAGLVVELSAREKLAPQPPNKDLRILDAGCGTGLLGACLRREIACDIAGFDLSQEMVDEARGLGVYRALWGRINLNENVVEQIGEGGFDLAVACGVFTLGHVPPASLTNLLDTVRPGGVVLVSARNSYCEQTDFDGFCDGLVADGLALNLLSMTGPYIAAEDARYRALQRP